MPPNWIWELRGCARYITPGWVKSRTITGYGTYQPVLCQPCLSGKQHQNHRFALKCNNCYECAMPLSLLPPVLLCVRVTFPRHLSVTFLNIIESGWLFVFEESVYFVRGGKAQKVKIALHKILYNTCCDSIFGIPQWKNSKYLHTDSTDVATLRQNINHDLWRGGGFSLTLFYTFSRSLLLSAFQSSGCSHWQEVCKEKLTRNTVPFFPISFE